MLQNKGGDIFVLFQEKVICIFVIENLLKINNEKRNAFLEISEVNAQVIALTTFVTTNIKGNKFSFMNFRVSNSPSNCVLECCNHPSIRKFYATTI